MLEVVAYEEFAPLCLFSDSLIPFYNKSFPEMRNRPICSRMSSFATIRNFLQAAQTGIPHWRTLEDYHSEIATTFDELRNDGVLCPNCRAEFERNNGTIDYFLEALQTNIRDKKRSSSHMTCRFIEVILENFGEDRPCVES
jgi:hypothetical protein